MLLSIKKYQVSLTATLIFFLSLTYFIYLSPPDITWANVFSDLGDMIWGPWRFGEIHPQGSPFYVGVGWIILHTSNLFLHFGSLLDNTKERFQILTITLSAIPAAITCLLLYLSTKNILASLAYAAVNIVVSQMLPKYYPLIGMWVLLLWLLRERKYSYWIVSYLAVCTHHLPGFMWITVELYRYFRVSNKLWKLDFTVVPAVLFTYWLFFVLAYRPYEIGWGTLKFHEYMFGQNILLGGLDVTTLSTVLGRSRELFLVILTGAGFSLLAFAKLKSSDFETRYLIWFMVGILLYYWSDLDPHTVTYTVPAFTIFAFVVGKLLKDKNSYLWKLSFISSIFFIAFNLQHYDLGKNLDPSPSSARQFYNELLALPKGSKLYAGFRGWEQQLNLNRNDAKDVILGISYQYKWYCYDYRSITSDYTRPYADRIIKMSEEEKMKDFPVCRGEQPDFISGNGAGLKPNVPKD